MKNRNYLLLTCAILLPLAAVAASSGLVFGQACSVQVGSITITQQQLTVPLSTTCPVSGPLWAVGTATDTTTNTNLGTSNIILTPANTYFSGQLTFSIPSTSVGHMVEVQAQVYNSYVNGQYSGLIGAIAPTITISPSTYSSPSYSYPAAPSYSYPASCYNGYYYYNGYPYYYNGYPYYYYYNNGYYYYYNGYYYSCG
ncbi:MAG TPA: hypothetical protein VLV31_12180 [Candidatus Acidoferrales bacterium]|nr:hypothetical protein [Candidatus Acidoferrales bacterium]